MFSGYHPFRYVNSDFVRDINWAIDHLKGKTRKTISVEYGLLTASEIKRRIERVERNVKGLALKWDKDKYEKALYWECFKEEGYTKEKYREILIDLLEDYKEYVVESLKYGSFYKPFAKDLPRKSKRIPRIKCSYCGK